MPLPDYKASNNPSGLAFMNINNSISLPISTSAEVQKWGNPFIIGKDADQNEVIRKYRERFENLRAEGSITDRDLIRLRGGRLGCYCSPLACHGDVLVEAIEALVKKRERNVF